MIFLVVILKIFAIYVSGVVVAFILSDIDFKYDIIYKLFKNDFWYENTSTNGEMLQYSLFSWVVVFLILGVLIVGCVYYITKHLNILGWYKPLPQWLSQWLSTQIKKK